MSWAPFENSEGLEWCVRILPTVLSPPCSPMHLDVTLATAALISLLQLRSSAPAQGSLNLYLSLSLTHTPSLFLQNSHGVFVSGGETKKKATQKKSLGPKSPRAHHARDVTVAAAANVGHVFARWRQLAPEQPRPTHFSSPFNDPRSMIMKFEPHKKKNQRTKICF